MTTQYDDKQQRRRRAGESGKNKIINLRSTKINLCKNI